MEFDSFQLTTLCGDLHMTHSAQRKCSQEEQELLLTEETDDPQILMALAEIWAKIYAADASKIYSSDSTYPSGGRQVLLFALRQRR